MNPNYLWELAERIKVAFFSSDQLVSVDFSNAQDTEDIGIESDSCNCGYIDRVLRDAVLLLLRSFRGTIFFRSDLLIKCNAIHINLS